ncbi:adenylyltransferase/cytidyltransferase family protein, partial [Halomonas sp. MG34]|nr:adenylyltransferase/cytidyltransferase family protein [Halomonas sp. MG34]
MKRVITYGTFDFLHPGHIRLLNRASLLGAYSFAVLSTDEFHTMKAQTANYAFESV